MSEKQRISLAGAAKVAGKLVAALSPGCERIEIAGSIRRGRPDVGDIELVAIPRIEQIRDGFFDLAALDRLEVMIDALIADSEISPHPTDPKRGERYAKLLHVESGLQLDLFMSSRESYGLILLIRTGPADYSRRFVTDIRPLGWHVAGGSLHRGSETCSPFRTCEPVPTPEEKDVYTAIGHPWVDPRARDGLARLGGKGLA